MQIMETKQTTKMRIATGLLLICVLAAALSGCNTQIQAADLMAGVSANTTAGKAADDAFIRAQADLSAALFRAAAAESRGESLLISPLSIQLALAMTANGADGQTLAEMETLLGSGIPLDELNEYYRACADALPSADGYQLHIANSIWFRDQQGLTVEKDFLQRNADYYGAQAYKAPFDGQTLKDINNWVKQNTNGMIDRILDEISAETKLYLINALTFDAEWAVAYEESDIRDGAFTSYGGEKRTVEMMHSEESKYFSGDSAVGFLKDYKDSKYAFAALLPDADVDLYAYIDSLTGEKLLQTLGSFKSGSVAVTMPKFSYDDELRLNGLLENLGMPTAFDNGKADFTRMASCADGNLFIGDILHKTFISVDERGTRAGAATAVAMNSESISVPELTVTLDRPFVFMILDNTNGLPIFIGAVTDIQA